MARTPSPSSYSWSRPPPMPTCHGRRNEPRSADGPPRPAPGPRRRDPTGPPPPPADERAPAGTAAGPDERSGQAGGFGHGWIRRPAGRSRHARAGTPKVLVRPPTARSPPRSDSKDVSEPVPPHRLTLTIREIVRIREF